MRTPYGALVRERVEALFCGFGLLFLLLAGRLFYIQVVNHAFYRDKANSFRTAQVEILSERAPIFDRNGEPLAVSQRLGSIIANPRLMRRDLRPERLRDATRELAASLRLPESDVARMLGRDRGYVALKRGVDWADAQQISALKIPGISVEVEVKRVYPKGRLAAQVLGFVDHKGRGAEGLEATWDKVLGGEPGLRRVQVDALGKAIPETERLVKAPRIGHPVTLSLDSVLQETAERELDKTVAQYRALGATCTVMDVHSGEVLVMAASPRFDPNSRDKGSPASRLNTCIKQVYEPGSTLKTISAASGLDSGKVSESSAWYCPGRILLGGRKLGCVVHRPFTHGHGTVRLKEILTYSCNIGAGYVGLTMGSELLRDYLARLGFTKRTGIELGGELSSLLPPGKHWAARTTACVAFGQSVAVTPLQLCRAYATLGNGGVAVQPTILKRPSGKPLHAHRALKKETAEAIVRLLEGVVDDGTGKPAKVRGFKMAGKTGSAQKAEGKRGYVPGKFIGSFVGLAPADHPRVAILVTVDEPKGSHWGATTAAPVWREVARQAMVRLSIAPDDPTDIVDGSEPSTYRRAKKRV